MLKSALHPLKVDHYDGGAVPQPLLTAEGFAALQR